MGDEREPSLFQPCIAGHCQVHGDPYVLFLLFSERPVGPNSVPGPGRYAVWDTLVIRTHSLHLEGADHCDASTA